MRTKNKSLVNNIGAFVLVTTANGYGSTNTKIRRFSTVVSLSPSHVTYVDSATLGASFTVVETGIYSITYGEHFSSAASCFGLSVNSTELTTNVNAINPISRLFCQGTLTTNDEPCVKTFTGRLRAGDVIRPHSGGVTTTATTTVTFYMIRIY